MDLKYVSEPDVIGLGRVIVDGKYYGLPAPVVARIEALEALLPLAREVAMWHVGDGDECGVTARELIERIDALTAALEPKPAADPSQS
jgi:hypothetical protein